MKVQWDQLLDRNSRVARMVANWGVGNVSTRTVRDTLTGTEFSGEFRRLVKRHGTMYGRRLARKALRRREYEV